MLCVDMCAEVMTHPVLVCCVLCVCVCCVLCLCAVCCVLCVVCCVLVNTSKRPILRRKRYVSRCMHAHGMLTHDCSSTDVCVCDVM